MTQKPLKTPKQVKAEYRAKGIPLSHIAKEQGWFPQDIYKVLNGMARCNYGKPHEIAVYFGLKHADDDGTAQELVGSKTA